MDLRGLIDRPDVDDPAFIADPYPVLGELREATPVFWSEATDRWMIKRFDDVFATLRDRRLGRDYTHIHTHGQFGRPAPDARLSALPAHAHA